VPLTSVRLFLAQELAFDDGDPPPSDLQGRWLDLVEACFFGKGKGTEKKLEKGERISVHCIAGLGRAPVLVAIALIEFAAMEPLHAVTVIRASRRGAINMKQLRRVRRR